MIYQALGGSDESDPYIQFYCQYPIAKSVIAQFGLTLPVRPSISFTPSDWQDDSYFARLFRGLPWTHFIELIRMDDPLKRAFYEVEALGNRRSVRELKRQIASLLYQRVGLSPSASLRTGFAASAAKSK